MTILVIQTAFIGDVILATALIEKLHAHFPEANIDMLVQKGHESLFVGHPFLREVLTFDKKQKKRKELIRLIRAVRQARYEWVINLHRFASSGLITALSRANRTSGFAKNPLSRFFTHRHPHEISATGSQHEVERNQALIAAWTDGSAAMPRLYPSESDRQVIPASKQYVCMAPASVWFTKQYPKARWIELVNAQPKEVEVHLLGAPGDARLCAEIQLASRHPQVRNRAGELSLLQSAALISAAQMNYVNDSAPLHLASAMNAPVTAIFCSTVPQFGFGPLSTDSRIVETSEKLACRPCGIHGKKACPEGHFRCAEIGLGNRVGKGLGEIRV